MRRKTRRLENEETEEKAGESNERRVGRILRRRERRLETEKKEEKAGN